MPALPLPPFLSVPLTSPSPVCAQFSRLSGRGLGNGISKLPSGSNTLGTFGPRPVPVTPKPVCGLAAWLGIARTA